MIDVDADLTDTTGTIPIASGDGTAAQARFVGDNFAFHWDMLSVSLDLEAIIGGGTAEFDNSFIGISYQWEEMFSIGIGSASGDSTDPGGNEEESLPLLGATLVLGESLLVGAATGTETLGDGTGTGDVDRSVVMLGVGMFSRDKMGGFHLEAYIDNRASGENTTAGTSEDKEESFGLTAEIVFMENFLVGIATVSTETSDTTGVVEDISETILSAGWVSGEGLSFVVISSTQEETDVASGDIIDLNFLVLAVAYAF